MKKIFVLGFVLALLSSCVSKSKYDLLEERVERMEKLFCSDKSSYANKDGARNLHENLTKKEKNFTIPIDTFLMALESNEYRRRCFVNIKKTKLVPMSYSFKEFEEALGVQKVGDEYEVFYDEITNSIIQIELLEKRIEYLESANDILRNYIKSFVEVNSRMNGYMYNNMHNSLDDIAFQLRMNNLLK
jgi:hypothetical protein